MAYKVKFDIPFRELGKADIVFKVSEGDSALGTFKVSKGAVVWVPRSSSYGYKMTWKKFQEVMKKEGKKEGE